MYKYVYANLYVILTSVVFQRPTKMVDILSFWCLNKRINV